MIQEVEGLFYLKFELRAMVGAIPLAQAREVLPMARLIEPPHLSSSVAGLLNLSGRNLPVLRLDRLLGLEGFTPGVDSHLILIKSDRLPCVLMVDRALGVDRVMKSELQDVPGYLTVGGGVSAQYQAQGRTINVLALDKILDAPARALRVVA